MTIRFGSDEKQESIRDITKAYKIDHNELDTSFRMADFESAIADKLRDQLQKENQKATKTGKAVSDTASVNNFENDELTKFYKAEIEDLLSNVKGMNRRQLKTQQTRMAQLMGSLEDSGAKETEFLKEQMKKSNEFLNEEAERKNSLGKRANDTWDEFRDTFVDIESLAMGIVGNNPLAGVAIKMIGNYLKRNKEAKKEKKRELEAQIHREQMAEHTESEKQRIAKQESKNQKDLDKIQRSNLATESRFIRRKAEEDIIEESNKQDQKTEEEYQKYIGEDTATSSNGSNSLGTESSPLIVRDDNIETVVDRVANDNKESVEEESVADRITDSNEVKAERKVEQTFYKETLQWQKDVMKILKGGGIGLAGGIGGAGIGAGAGSGGSSGGMMETAIGSAIGGAIASKISKAKELAGKAKDKLKKGASKLIPKKLSHRLAVVGGMVGMGSLMGGDDAEAEEPQAEINPADLPAHERIAKKVEEDQSNMIKADVGVGLATPALQKMAGKGLSKFIPGLGAVGDAGYEYAEGGSVGSAMTAGGGALAGAGAGASLGASAGLLFGPGAVVASPVLGAIGGILGGIGGAMGATSLFGDSDEEKGHNLVSRDLQDRGYINRDDLMPFDDSELLKPNKLQELTVQELQSLLAIDDFDEDDTALIQENLDIKMGKKEKLSKESQAMLDQKQADLEAESSGGNFLWNMAKSVIPGLGVASTAYDAMTGDKDKSKMTKGNQINGKDVKQDEFDAFEKWKANNKKNNVTGFSSNGVDKSEEEFWGVSHNGREKFEEERAEQRNNQKTLTGKAEQGHKGLGGVSAKYETGGKGAGTISSGRGDPGGKSYGTYQLASKTGTLQKYLEQSKYKDQLGGEVNSQEFQDNWKKLAKENPEFGQDQHDFIKKTHYDPVMSDFKKQSGMESLENMPGLQDALWSQSVQHSGGGNSEIIKNALANVGEGATEEDYINALYGARGNYTDKIGARKGNAQVSGLSGGRYAKERLDALELAKTGRGEDPTQQLAKNDPINEGLIKATKESNNVTIDPFQEKLAKADQQYYDKDTATFMNSGNAGTSSLDAKGGLVPNKPPSQQLTAQIDSTKAEIDKQKEEKNKQPVVINSSVANNSSGGGGGGGAGSSTPSGARNTESSINAIVLGQLKGGMV